MQVRLLYSRTREIWNISITDDTSQAEYNASFADNIGVSDFLILIIHDTHFPPLIHGNRFIENPNHGLDMAVGLRSLQH
jgi:hypothetical protein